MTSLVDRYVHTALRHIPQRQRADIDRELRASIADAVDARVEAGEPEEAALEATLLELGDPQRLADRYTDRPRYLIGPELFPAWRRLMTFLLSVVLPIVIAVAVVVRLVEEPTIGAAIGAAIATALTAGAQIAFWAVLVFAILERVGAGRAELRTPWTLKDLPEYEPDRQTRAQLAVNLVWPVLLVVALVLQQFTFTAQPVLDPANWSFWWPYLIGVFVLEGVYAVWVYRLGTWTRAVAAANAGLALLAAVPMVWLLATDRFFNPEFLDRLDWGATDPRRWLTLITVTVVVLGSAWDVLDVALRAERARRGLPTRIPGTGGYTLGTR